MCANGLKCVLEESWMISVWVFTERGEPNFGNEIKIRISCIFYQYKYVNLIRNLNKIK